MLNFKKIGKEDAPALKNFYNNCPYESSEYSVGIKVFWSKFYSYEYAITDKNCLVVKYHDGGSTVFDFPVSFTNNNEDINDALDEIDLYCADNYIVPVFSDIPKAYISVIIERYNFTKIENFREAQDYVYAADDLKYFKGRHYAGQRNHINKFKSLYPDYIFRSLKPEDNPDEFWEKYYEHFDKSSVSAIQEKEVAMDMVKNADSLTNFVSECIEISGKIAAICVAEIKGDTMITHIEKALSFYEGIYPLMVSEFLSHYADDSIKWVNREDDSSDKGLRTSKLQYRPHHLVSKYVVLVQSELLYVESFPEIKTERLSLGEIKSAEAEIYQKLCFDDERNKMWGYDYRNDLEPEYINSKLPEDYFYNVAKNDFSERLCMNFAIRLNGEFIGEAVLYNADYKGSIELGCRIFNEFSGHGYGTEAFKNVSDWAIYSAGFRKVVAKCFKENQASYNMLSSCMKKCGEDEIYYYFEKIN